MEISREYIMPAISDKFNATVTNQQTTSNNQQIEQSDLNTTTNAQNEKQPETDAVKTTLNLMGFKATPENIEIASALIKNLFPVSKENMQKMNQAFKLTDGDINKSLFFLQNDIKPGIKNTELLNMITDKNNMLSNTLEQIVSQTTSYALKTGDMELLKNLFSLSDGNKENMISFLNTIKSTNNELGKLIGTETEKIPEDTQNKNIDNNTSQTENTKSELEQFITQNKKILIPKLNEAIQKNSLEIFKQAVKNEGFNGKMDFEKAFTILLNDNPSLKNKALSLIKNVNENTQNIFQYKDSIDKPLNNSSNNNNNIISNDKPLNNSSNNNNNSNIISNDKPLNNSSNNNNNSNIISNDKPLSNSSNNNNNNIISNDKPLNNSSNNNNNNNIISNDKPLNNSSNNNNNNNIISNDKPLSNSSNNNNNSNIISNDKPLNNSSNNNNNNNIISNDKPLSNSSNNNNNNIISNDKPLNNSSNNNNNNIISNDKPLNNSSNNNNNNNIISNDKPLNNSSNNNNNNNNIISNDKPLNNSSNNNNNNSNIISNDKPLSNSSNNNNNNNSNIISNDKPLNNSSNNNNNSNIISNDKPLNNSSNNNNEVFQAGSTDKNTNGNINTEETLILENKLKIITELNNSIKNDSPDSFRNLMKELGFNKIPDTKKILQIVFNEKPDIQKEAISLINKRNTTLNRMTTLLLTSGKNKETISLLLNNLKSINNSFNKLINDETLKIQNSINSENLKTQNNTQVKNTDINTSKTEQYTETENRTLTKNNNTNRFEITAEQFITANKKLLMPKIYEAIQKNSLDIFTKATENYGFKGNINLEKAFTILLWDNPSLKNKAFSLIKNNNNNNNNNNILNHTNKISDIANNTSKNNNIQKNSENNNINDDISHEEALITKNKFKIINELNNLIKNNSIDRFKNAMKEIGFNKTPDINKIAEILFKDKPNVQKKVLSLFNKRNDAIGKLTSEIFSQKAENIKDINSYTSNLYNKLNELRLAAETSNNFAAKQILNDINNITNTNDFAAQIKNIHFVQVPVTINNTTVNAELYVFNNKKGKSKTSNSTSALISLNLAFLGHFEAYIQNVNRKITCQFRIENKHIQSLIEKNINSLSNGLKQYNYSLNQISFKKTDETFSILDSEPSFNKKDNTPSNLRNYTFDLQM